MCLWSVLARLLTLVKPTLLSLSFLLYKIRIEYLTGKVIRRVKCDNAWEVFFHTKVNCVFSLILIDNLFLLCPFFLRKSLLHAKSCWSMTCSRGKQPLNHPGLPCSPPSLPASTAPYPSWAVATRPPPSVMAAPRLSQNTVSHCSGPWPPTQP